MNEQISRFRAFSPVDGWFDEFRLHSSRRQEISCWFNQKVSLFSVGKAVKRNSRQVDVALVERRFNTRREINLFSSLVRISLMIHLFINQNVQSVFDVALTLSFFSVFFRRFTIDRKHVHICQQKLLIDWTDVAHRRLLCERTVKIFFVAHCRNNTFCSAKSKNKFLPKWRSLSKRIQKLNDTNSSLSFS